MTPRAGGAIQLAKRPGSTTRPISDATKARSASAFVLRFFTADHRGDRLLVVNLGAELHRESFAEPLLAPPPGTDWQLRWSSEDTAYDGPGMAELFPDERWHIPVESALLLIPGPARPPRPAVSQGGEKHG